MRSQDVTEPPAPVSSDEPDRDPRETFATNLLDGRVALISGGGTGIGFGIAQTLGLLGARVSIMSRKTDILDNAVSKLQAHGIDAMYASADVRNLDQVQAAVDATVERFGALDILVNNAAGLFHCPAEELTANGWKVLVEIDLNGTFFCCRAAFAALKRSKYGGRIISIVSPFAWTSWPGASNATAAKAGIISLSHTLAQEWAHAGILVNTVAPGPIRGTGGIDRISEDPDRKALELAHVALGRFGQIADIAEAVVYLSSPAGSYITGADLLIDGGRQFNFVPSKLTRLRSL
jgi:NAD(P)-dependent dehydrogenase (short-subunit alcohol dehydrogenase family)